jgi:hypothetical protein
MVEWRWFEFEVTLYDDTFSPKGGRISVSWGLAFDLPLILM